MDRDSSSYENYMQFKQNRYEALCKRCGACCGVFEDPCRNLAKDDRGAYFCQDYQNRLGLQNSLSGKEFRCVPIRTILDKSWKNDFLCAYKNQLRLPWIE